MKTKTINDRPMIVVSQSVTKWCARYNATEKKFELYSPSNPTVILTPKQETLTTGIFELRTGNYGYDRITRTGKVMSSWEFYKHPEPADFYSVQEMFQLLGDKVQGGLMRHIEIKRILFTYTNSKTKERTKDKKIAESWFKGEDPFWVSAKKEQQVGLWVEDGGDHAEVSTWYNDGITKDSTERWQKAESSSFWLYPDGTISHFWKGKFYDENRKFCEERVNYRSFDHRFRELCVSQYMVYDLRAKDISKRTGESNTMAEETKRIFKKLGFPESFWTWGDNYKRKFDKATDILFFIHYKQTSQVPKKQVQSQHNIENIPFDIYNKDSYIVDQGKDMLFRIPRVTINYVDDNEEPTLDKWRLANPRIHSIKITEAYRILVRKDGKEMSYLKSIHEGSDWATCKLYDIMHVRYADASDYLKQEMSTTQVQLYDSLIKECNATLAIIKSAAVKTLSFFSYYPDVITESSSWKEVFSFIECIKKAPSLVDTLIKTGNVGLLKAQTYEPGYYLDYIFKIYAMNPGEYKERKRGRLWTHLQVSKEQFYYGLAYPTKAKDIFGELRSEAIPAPVKVGIPVFDPSKTYKPGDIVQQGFFMYRKTDFIGEKITPQDETAAWAKINYPQKNDKTILSEIPMKYINLLDEMFFSRGDSRIYDFRNMTRRGDFSFSWLEIVSRRGLSLTLLHDYWGIIDNIRWIVGDAVADSWERLPKNPESLRQLHDEANLRLTLAREERSARLAAEKAEEERTNSVRYEKFVKALKDFIIEDDKFVVVVPQTLGEIVDEGARMHHCVGSYTGRVAKGETFVFFLRKKEDISQCYVTFNILPSNTNRRQVRADMAHKWLMDQAFAAHDQKPEKEAIDFLKSWAAQKDVEFSTILKACI